MYKTEPGSRLGLGKRLGRDTARVVTQTEPRDVLHCMMSNSDIRSSGRKEEGERFVVYVFVSSKSHRAC